MTNDIVVIGGGPSGLAAAHEAVGRGARVIVVERLDQVGGLARTLEFEAVGLTLALIDSSRRTMRFAISSRRS